MTAVADPHPEIFEALLSVLRGLESPGSDPATLARYLEIHLLRASGLLPKAEAFRKLLNIPFSQTAGLRLERETELPLRRLLQGLVRRALERELRSRSFLQVIGLEAA
jgi:hypothetical protein